MKSVAKNSNKWYIVKHGMDLDFMNGHVGVREFIPEVLCYIFSVYWISDCQFQPLYNLGMICQRLTLSNIMYCHFHYGRRAEHSRNFFYHLPMLVYTLQYLGF